MTEKYDPYENALAERINKTMKYEFGLNQTMPNKTLAQKMVRRAVRIYNDLRPHDSFKGRTPVSVHLKPDVPYKSYRKNKEIIYLIWIENRVKSVNLYQDVTSIFFLGKRYKRKYKWIDT